MARYLKPQKGQSLVAAIALFAVAAVMLFYVFNSGRAVNEKINLVNAADAAAYSGAQVAARSLNFMAYTNRAMIANEVAIGHMFSYQVEADVLSSAIPNAIENLEQFIASVPGLSFLIWLAELLIPGFDLSQQLDDLSNIVSDLADSSRVLSTMMMLLYNANSAEFAEFQQQAYLDLITQADYGGVADSSIIEATMQVVANTYGIRDGAPITVNNAAVLGQFANSVDPAVAAAANSAGDVNQQLCQLIAFATPSADGDPVSVDNGCAGLIDGSNSQVNVATGDAGYLIDAIRQTYSEMDAGMWIQDRNVSYMLLGLFPAQRIGGTELQFSDGHITWGSTGDQLTISGVPSDVVQGDVNSFVEASGQFLDQAGLQALSNMGLCNNGVNQQGQSCVGLLNQEYRSVQQYAVLNNSQPNAVVTAFLNQSNCSDSIGFDDSGNPIPGWKNDLRYLEEDRPVCNKQVYAVAQARIFYQRPECYDSGGDCSGNTFGFNALEDGNVEAPNLFNPFWQVSLIQTGAN